ncbi:hypoxanthine phosphoribosyltransferase [Rhabdothermincola sp.]|uniref:hypoxanthine phosphoribosyltransferase n=1 Tax=Rhabdothermincola sp. TaxID=2820405 RepID=UPI002FE0A3DC
MAIGAAVTRLGREISARHRDGLVIVAVLKGSLLFVSDLMRSFTIQPVVDFLAISRYAPDSGRVRIVKDLDLDISGRDVVLVEDIVDTGLTLGFLLGELGRRSPASLEVCTLLDKRVRRILPAPLAYVGFEVPDVFVLGYGLDFAGRYRNLDMLIAADPVALTADPDIYVDQLYGAHSRGSG